MCVVIECIFLLIYLWSTITIYKGLKSYGRGGHGAFSDCHPVGGQLADAMVVDKGCHNHKHMEDLMGLEPDVTLPREPSLRDSQGIEHSSKNVKKTHQDEPAQ